MLYQVSHINFKGDFHLQLFQARDVQCKSEERKRKGFNFKLFFLMTDMHLHTTQGVQPMHNVKEVIYIFVMLFLRHTDKD